MDKEIKNKIEKLKEMGMDEKRLHALIMLGFEDFLDEVEQDLIEASQSDLDLLLSELENAKSEDMKSEEAAIVLRDMLRKVYGINAENKWNTFLLGYLDQCVEEGAAIQDFLAKLKNDDPEALKQVIAAQQDPDFEAAKAAVEAASKLE
ncbi:hypothetical protein CVU76_03170 [Candidatus Dojkabacteria bacterium HGW-Dojkabacteria-1]|uniref:Uncharacterized protein n=1 Tax=Candidatus Dojkabacteria bacterium HGW-Dojkabacteria-1 TaxID=2013761 RepID=A0A2N2F460_9BACT|nr:MAG: hypothetical protein CVU76_03170 [Candidatus Dojkabacteria bacterium HGW-Dojkabacteria-1]